MIIYLRLLPALAVVSSLAEGCSTSKDQDADRRNTSATGQSFVFQRLPFPIPVGLNPENVALAASDWVSMNDRSKVFDGARSGDVAALHGDLNRSEERRVGKECRSR